MTDSQKAWTSLNGLTFSIQVENEYLSLTAKQTDGFTLCAASFSVLGNWMYALRWDRDHQISVDEEVVKWRTYCRREQLLVGYIKFDTTWRNFLGYVIHLPTNWKQPQQSQPAPPSSVHSLPYPWNKNSDINPELATAGDTCAHTLNSCAPASEVKCVH